MGFVFSIDATLSAFLMVLMVSTVLFLSVQADDDPYAEVQMVRVGKDVLSAMDRQGTLASGNASLIGSTLAAALPSHLGANLNIETYRYENSTFSLINTLGMGGEVPANISTYGVRRDFVSMKNGMAANYSKVRMTIWQK